MEALLARTPDGARPADAAVLACKSVKNKLARICDIFEALLAAPPAVEYWPEWVARATALLSQYENLLREMQPLLLRFLLVPRLQDASGGPLASVENIPNVLLRTRLAPEVEEHLQALSDTGEQPAENAALVTIAQVLGEASDVLRGLPKAPPTPSASEDLRLVRIARLLTCAHAS